MKKLIIFLAFLMFVSGYSQENTLNIKVNKSKLFKEKKDWEIKTILQDAEGNFFSIRSYSWGYISQKTKYLFNKFDSNYNKVLSYEFKLEKNSTISVGAVTNDKFYFIEYKKDKKNKRIIAYAHSSPLDKFQFQKKEIFTLKIDKFPGFFDSLFSGSKMDANLDGNMSFSENGDFLVFNIDSYAKKNEKHAIIVLNHQLEELWRKDFTLPIKDAKFETEDIKVSNKGAIFVLGKVFHKGRTSKRKGKANYHHQLIKLTKEGNTSVDLKVENHFVGSLNITFTNQNNIGCIGFYSDKNDYRYKGICTFFINPEDNTIISKNFSPFTKQFITDKYGKLKDKELQDIVLRDVYYADNGEITFTAEESYVTIHTTYNNGITNTYYRYHFDDIVIVRTDPKGKLKWARNINKAQTSGNYYDPLLSFSSIINQKNVYLFLNAHKNMGNLSGSRAKFRQNWLSGITKRNSKMYVLKFNDKGEWIYKDIQSNKESQTIINSRFMKEIGANKAIFYGSYKKKKQFITIEF